MFFNTFVYTFHMPIFFALSGALLGLAVKKKGIESLSVYQYAVRKVHRIIVPFFIVTLLYCIPIRYIIEYFDASTSISTVIKECFINVESTHMWFLPTLFWLMLFLLMWVKLLQKKPKWFIPSLLFILLLHLIGIPTSIKAYLGIFCISKALNNVVFVVTGYILERYGMLQLINKKVFASFFIIWLLAEYLHFAIPGVLNSGIRGFLETKFHLIVNDIIGVCAIIVCFKLAALFKSRNLQNVKWLKSLDSSSFEIYLYSEPINYLILYACVEIGECYVGGYSLYFIRVFLSLCIAWWLSYIIRVNYGQK